jgi:hypothetical protein
MGEIEDVTENPADRRAYRMQDTKRLVRMRRHGQDRRLPTRMVSPRLTPGENPPAAAIGADGA